MENGFLQMYRTISYIQFHWLINIIKVQTFFDKSLKPHIHSCTQKLPSPNVMPSERLMFREYCGFFSDFLLAANLVKMVAKQPDPHQIFNFKRNFK